MLKENSAGLARTKFKTVNQLPLCLAMSMAKTQPARFRLYTHAPEDLNFPESYISLSTKYKGNVCSGDTKKEHSLTYFTEVPKVVGG